MTNQESAVTTFVINGTSYTMPFIRYCEMVADLRMTRPPT